ncbi:MAG: hypothetical protein QOD99_2010 [Chthoniobacter sp.]|nr:hypothetical protein [Chthoniobacter sp.]
MRYFPLTSLRSQAALLFFGASALYLLTASCSLDEWDSVQFALGVHDFDIAKHQPHPPGYPLYEFSGWVLSSLFGWSAQQSLTVCSALGGGLFVASWFGIFAQFVPRPAALSCGLAIAVTPVVWLTSTKVLTDAPAAGFFAMELLAGVCYARNPARRTLIAAALAGAAAAGFRPQNFAVASIPLVFCLISSRASRRQWLLGFAVFFFGCLTWFAPLMWMQAHSGPGEVNWLAYPQQLLTQWKWRLDKPGVYIGAGHWDWSYFSKRFDEHIRRGWFSLGLGIDGHRRHGKVVLALLITGWVAFLRRRTLPGSFWKMQAAWAPAYVLMIFVCLPGDQRYYLPIIPLLVATAVLGLSTLTPRFQFAPLALAGTLLVITAPLAMQAHREEAPPIRSIRYLQSRFAPDERGNVWLCFSSARRHAGWYAEGFGFSPGLSESHDFLVAARKSGQSVFCDDLAAGERAEWKGAKLTKVFAAQRSPVIYRKHAQSVLYEVRWP